MSEKRFTTKNIICSNYCVWDNNDKPYGNDDVVELLNEQQELIEELQVSDEMGWKRAEHFEKKCPKELHNKKMYIKRLEYKVQKFKEENEQLRQRYYALKKENDRLENNIIHLNEANDFRKKNLKIMELSDTKHNLKMLLANSDEQTERFIKGLQDENRKLRQQLQEKQEDEKLYAQEILELNKTKKEMLNFRNLGSDY